MNTKSRRLIFTFALLSLSLTHFADGAPVNIKVGYPQLSGGSMPLWVITDSKLDQRYGVDVKTV